jgi:hypothetical protein
VRLIVTFQMRDGVPTQFDRRVVYGFDPLELFDEMRPLDIPSASSGLCDSEATIERTRKLRKDASQRLAALLAPVLYEAMSSGDLVDGYPRGLV